MSRPGREPPTAAHMLAKVREDVFPLPRFALNAEVRIEVGADVPELRTADGVVVDTRAGESWHFIVLEVKRSRKDLRLELDHAEKSTPHDRVCAERYIVLPAPAGDYLHRGEELPTGCGLIEVGLHAVVLIPALPHRVEPPSIGFLKAIYRVAATVAERLERDDAVVGAPLVPIVRHLGRSVALACGHAAPMPRQKRTPRALPCFACLDGRPLDRDVVLAALEEAGEADLAAYLDAIAARAARVAPSAPNAALLAAEGGRA